MIRRIFMILFLAATALLVVACGDGNCQTSATNCMSGGDCGNSSCGPQSGTEGYPPENRYRTWHLPGQGFRAETICYDFSGNRLGTITCLGVVSSQSDAGGVSCQNEGGYTVTDSCGY